MAAAYVEMVGQFVPPAFGEGAGYGLPGFGEREAKAHERRPALRSTGPQTGTR
jgi:hypothetical protein